MVKVGVFGDEGTPFNDCANPSAIVNSWSNPTVTFDMIDNSFSSSTPFPVTTITPSNCGLTITYTVHYEDDDVDYSALYPSHISAVTALQLDGLVTDQATRIALFDTNISYSYEQNYYLRGTLSDGTTLVCPQYLTIDFIDSCRNAFPNAQIIDDMTATFGTS